METYTVMNERHNLGITCTYIKWKSQIFLHVLSCHNSANEFWHDNTCWNIRLYHLIYVRVIPKSCPSFIIIVIAQRTCYLENIDIKVAGLPGCGKAGLWDWGDRRDCLFVLVVVVVAPERSTKCFAKKSIFEAHRENLLWWRRRGSRTDRRGPGKVEEM